MRDHIVVHGKKAKEHEKEPLWEECFLQSYFTTRSRVNYFVVIEAGTKDAIGGSTIDPILLQLETDLFVKLEKDYRDVRRDLEEQASIVHDFGDSKPERVPWLERTGLPYHLSGLKDIEIQASYRLRPKKELVWDTPDAVDPDLVRSLVAAEGVLRDAY